MPVGPLNHYICPIDGLVLLRESNSYVCEKGHSFDLARAGYCNFHLVQNKASLEPGDSQEMVAARKNFLDAGYYAPLAHAVCEEIRSISKHSSKMRILDAGCGEGYYLQYLQEEIDKDSSAPILELAGIDISKSAILAAAKRSKQIAWAVASNRKLPFAPGSIDLILSIFGFPVWESFAGLQHENGFLLLVDPGSEHLLELRKLIYAKVNETNINSIEGAFACGYRLVKESALKFTINLQSQVQIQNLLAMTPHGYRVNAQGRIALEALEQLTVSVDVVLRVLQK